MNKSLRRFCVAPMMGYTTPHARRLYRILSKKAFLFTEMIPSNTLIHSIKKNYIIKNNNQNPIALQIGGSNYKNLIQCSKVAQSYNYDEINLNVGCPSKAAQKGNFGACLMKEAHIVRDCLKAMLDNFDKEVSMKCRIGINKENSYNFFKEFIDVTVSSGIKVIYVHARNALLNDLNPKNNRTIPQLKYEYIAKIKEDFPEVQFIINGGINSLEHANKLCKEFDGVMVGRLIQSNPFCLIDIDRMFFNESKNNDEYTSIVLEYFKYIKENLNQDSIFRLLSPLLYIFFAVPNGKKYKAEIHQKIKNYEIDKLETMFLRFIN